MSKSTRGGETWRLAGDGRVASPGMSASGRLSIRANGSHQHMRSDFQGLSAVPPQMLLFMRYIFGHLELSGKWSGFFLLSVVNPGVPQKTEPVKKIVCSVFEERRSEGNENKPERRKPTTTWYSGIMVTEDHVYMFWEICAQLNRKGEVIC